MRFVHPARCSSWLWACVGLGACAPGGLAEPAPWLQTPVRTTFQAPKWQELTVLGLTVENQGLAEANLRLEADEPLQIDASGLSLAPGQAAEVVISWIPADFEPLRASVQWSWEGGSATTRVTGQVPKDGDLDGHLHPAAGGEDCDDQDATIFPGADDPPGGPDQDCDGI